MNAAPSMLDTVAAPLPLQWYADLHNYTPPPTLVQGLIAEGSLCLVYGESNTGKTFAVLDLALSIAGGQPWRGRRVRGGLAVYVAGEGAATVRARVAAYQRKNAEAVALPFVIVPQAVNLTDRGGVSQLVATIRHAEARSGQTVVLVVIDTLARCLIDRDENSSADIGAAISEADYIRQATGACVALVHHSGKDTSKGARGSSALRAAVDTELLVEGTAGARSITVTKQRDLEPAQPMGFELEPVEIGTNEYGEPITSCVVRHLDGVPASAHGPSALELRGKAQRQLLACLRAQRADRGSLPLTLMELREVGRKAGMHKSTARAAADVLVASPYMVPSVGGYVFTDGVET